MHRPGDAMPATMHAALRSRAAPPPLTWLDLHPSPGDVRAEVLAGLSADPPSLPSKLFYDEAGSRLFERITALPEYYQTRTELAILRACAGELAESVGRGGTLIEFGSGSSVKTRLLLEALDVRRYVPIDISRWSLTSAAERLRANFPDLLIRPIIADYTQSLRLPTDVDDAGRVAFFPGGTIGNFTPDQAAVFLRRIAPTLGAGGRLIVGVDLKKDPALLHAAYNDAAGVTAAFNRNLLARLNRELGADFDLARWHHYAPYDPVLGRIEMHLISAVDQMVLVAGGAFAFALGQSIHTENSYKYTLGDFADLAARGAFAVERVWTDERQLFSVQLLRVRADASLMDRADTAAGATADTATPGVLPGGPGG